MVTVGNTITGLNIADLINEFGMRQKKRTSHCELSEDNTIKKEGVNAKDLNKCCKGFTQLPFFAFLLLLSHFPHLYLILVGIGQLKHFSKLS